MPYHHGDLRRTLLDAALVAIAEHGPVAVSLRELARRAGVSHAAPTHHFRDKTGLLTAVAAEGWTLLADALDAVTDREFSEMGVAYVVFATTHPAHFAVMRTPGLVHADDPALVAAQQRAGRSLQTEPDGAARDRATALAGWSLVHGLSALLLEGLVAPDPGSDVEALARAVTGRLGRPLPRRQG
nr:TetR/AcrR family transcriptional regulator [Pseudonocardia lacus]